MSVISIHDCIIQFPLHIVNLNSQIFALNELQCIETNNEYDYFTCSTELKVDIEEEVGKYRVYAERMRPLVANTVAYIHKCLQDNKKVLVEGANAAMLDIDFGE